MIFSYLAYGISILSEIELPMLFASETVTDSPLIYIKCGQVPDNLNDQIVLENDFTQVSSSELLFRIPEVGTFYVYNGDNILVEPLHGLSEYDNLQMLRHTL